ncbi:amidohydrolase family protein [Alsobacter sp. SYSU M60028]|uniref:Amidohydrolase family protein n=1 Tax=Alsobacter ponti TaxID=2962936 RepID=A0ABT1LF00_9HYPH|nr:amidohydrolase family protein [Alsobacter ponti]
MAVTTVVTGRRTDTGEPVAVSIRDGAIAAIAPGPADDGAWLAPGLVDLQLNGWRGHDLNNGRLTPDTVRALARAVLATGVTAFLPTLITAAEADIVSALRAIAAARAADPLVARMVAGVHVEGPGVAPEDGPRGAHPREHVRAPDLAEFDRWQAACGGLVRLVTLSPHWPDAPAVIAGLAARGVVVSLGHTGVDPAAIHAAALAGATLSTHLGNGVAAVLPRHPNLIWAQLAEDRLSASFIADGHHLPDDTLKAMLRAKGLDRSLLVSDATALGGMPPGVYDQAIGGRVELTPQGRLGVAGTPYLAGAALPLAAGVATAMRAAGLSLWEALRLASVNPARLIGRKAELAVGARADLLRFRWSPGDAALAVDSVYSGGETA